MLVLGQYTDHGPTPLNPHLITRKQIAALGSWAFSAAHYIEYLRAIPRVRGRFALEQQRLAPEEQAAALVESRQRARAAGSRSAGGWQRRQGHCDTRPA